MTWLNDFFAWLVDFFSNPDHLSGPDAIPVRLLEHLEFSAMSQIGRAHV